MHRVVYCEANDLAIDEIKGKVVRHTCDNRRCINPEHLLLGTHQDNMDDMKSRGRASRHTHGKVRGEKHGCAKLTEDQARAIKAWPGSIRSACREFNMSYGQVQRIRAGENWRHL